MTTPQDPNTPQGDGFPPASGEPAAGGYGAPAGGQAPGGYGPPGGGQPGYGGSQAAYPPPAGAASPFGQPGGPQLADWGTRAYSGLIDFIGPALVAGVLYQLSTTLGTLANLAALAWAIYNGYLNGSTGQSYGKKIAGTRVLREQDGQVIGGGLGVGRYFLHILDAIPCYVGFLWPLWDAKKQTFADKIIKTVVVKA